MNLLADDEICQVVLPEESIITYSNLDSKKDVAYR